MSVSTLTWQKYAAWFQPFFAPRSCEACGSAEARELCQGCEAQLRYLGDNVCERCALPFTAEGTISHCCAFCLTRPPVFDKVVSVFEFAGAVLPLLHAAKFAGNRRALRILAERGRSKFRQTAERFCPDFICPMPLPFFRRLKRGFNQSYLLAQDFNRTLPSPLPFLEGTRRLWRAPQATQGRSARLHALRGTMRYAGKINLKGKRILVVDDVVTTGSTAENLARVLKEAGAETVEVFSVARVRRTRP